VIGDAANDGVARLEWQGRADVLAHDRSDAVSADHRVAFDLLTVREVTLLVDCTRVTLSRPSSFMARLRAPSRPPAGPTQASASTSTSTSGASATEHRVGRGDGAYPDRRMHGA
jgi:hypothetical protein